MRRVLAGCAALIAIGGCKSTPDAKFGPVTDDAQAAIRGWCKQDLEMESHMERVGGKEPLFESPDLLIMDCMDADGHGSMGWLAFDSKTRAFVNAYLNLESPNFDNIVNRVIVPLLDPEEKAGYDGLRAFLAKPNGENGKEWAKGKAYIRVQTVASDGPLPSSWIIQVGYWK